ncbi:MAG: transglutaminase-like cysteine peptidase [Sandarakinorhabdus sp.]|nr:transglutaminase-like cysteine peptidase [Sandarakinorhabdus sp.]
MHRLICAFIVVAAAAPAMAAPVTLDGDRWQQLSSVGRATFALPDVRDADRHGAADRWDIAGPAGGDCEDKALFARAALIEKGWPASSLRLALVWTETHEYHAVLTIDVVRRGEPATYVIDSRFAWVVGWDMLTRFGYRWDRRQSAQGPGWIRIAQP